MGAGINNADESFTTFIKDLIESKFTEKMIKLHPEQKDIYTKINDDPEFWKLVESIQKEIN